MKKSFTFLFIFSLLLTVFGSLSVKANPIVKYFGYHDGEWTPDGTVAQPSECCAGYIAASDKIVTGSDFYYSGKHQDAVERDGDNWTGFNGSNGTVKACTRTAVSLSASTTYTFSLLTKDKGEMNITLPKISIDGTNYVGPQKVLVNSVEQSFSNNQYRYTNNEETVLEYSITAPSSSSYTVSVQFTSGYRDKFKASTLTITQNAATYAVTATASNGTVSGAGSFAEGASVTLTASPNEDYSFSGWSTSDVNISGHENENPLTFTMPNKAVSITAIFTECTKHAVTLTAGDNGSVSGGGEQCDGSVTVTATPESGYRFVNWTNTSTSAVVSTNAVYTFTLSENISLTANFEYDPCSNSLTIQCEENTYQIDPALKTAGMSIPNYNIANNWYSGADGSYVDFNNDEGEIYYIIDLPAATYSFTVYKAHAGKSYLNIWEAGLGNELIYNGVEYGKHNGGSYNIIGDDAGGQNTPIHNSTISDVALSAGTYIIGLYGNSYAIYDKVIITATSNVFCPTYDITMVNNMGGAAPTADKVKAEENASVSISADETIGEFSFTGWTATAGSFDDASAASTTFTMPDEAVTITATYNTYSRTGAPIAAGNYGTICLPLNGTVTGATLYSVAGKETGDINYLVLEDKGTSLEAGKPYIFQLSADELSVALDGTYTDLQLGNGLVGTYETINLTPYAEPSTLNYVLNQNAFMKAGNNVTVGAYRAYLKWNEVSAPAPAPSARRIRMVIEGKEVETGMETVTAMPKTTKVLIDGQLFIIREGKRYTLTGARAQ